MAPVSPAVDGDRTGTGHRFAILEGYRGMAATMVVVTHAGFQSGAAVRGPWAGLLSRLDFGVAIFFLLSGFLLSRPHLSAASGGRRPPQLRVYLWHRFLRIFPAYWMAVLGAAVLLPANHDWSPTEWLVQLLLLQVYVPHGLQPGLTQMWSLSVELAFYLALPLIGLLVGRLGGPSARVRLNRQIALVAVLVTIALVWRVLVATWLGGIESAPYWVFAYLDWFAAGIGIAAVSAYRPDASEAASRTAATLRDLAKAPGACWLAALAIFWLASTSLAGPYDLSASSLGESLTKHIAYGAAATLIMIPAVLGAQESGLLATVMASRPAQFLGRVSYGIFLWNMCVLQVVYRALDLPVFGGGFWRGLILTYGSTVLVAWLSFRLVETPALRLKNRLNGSSSSRGGDQDQRQSQERQRLGHGGIALSELTGRRGDQHETRQGQEAPRKDR